MKTFSIRIAIAILFISVPFSQAIFKEWCVADNKAPDDVILRSMNWICSVYNQLCGRIQIGQNCYRPNTLRDHASVVFNSYYQRARHTPNGKCNFNGAARLVYIDPSHDACQFEFIPDSTK